MLSKGELQRHSHAFRTLLSVLVVWAQLVHYDSVEAQWTQLWSYNSARSDKQPSRRAAHAMVQFDDSLYVYGGMGTDANGEDAEFDDTWRFDLNGQYWTQINLTSTKPPQRFHHASALHSNETVNEMVVFGGLSLLSGGESDSNGMLDTLNVVQYNDIWRLSLSSDIWTMDNVSSNAAAPAARSEAATAMYGDSLIVFGGISYDEAGVNPPKDYNDLWSYDLVNCTWTQIVPNGVDRPPTRFSHSTSVLTDALGYSYLLVFSGRHLGDTTWTLLNDLWLFSFKTNTWIQVVINITIGRAYTSLVLTHGTQMWFFGGYYKLSQAAANGFVYQDVVSGKITMDTGSSGLGSVSAAMTVYRGVVDVNAAVPPLRYNHEAALWKDNMVIHGGSYQTQRGDIWMYNTTSAVLQKQSESPLSMDMQSLVYVLAGFVIAIIILLLLLLIRWRGIDRRNVEIARRRGTSIMRGVSKERLEQMQITKYVRPAITVTDIAVSADPDEKSENVDVCPICLLDFEDNEEVRNLPCKHIFHVPCIDEWLNRNTLCPMCKCNVDLVVEEVAIDVHQARGGAIVTPIGEGTGTPNPILTTQ